MVEVELLGLLCASSSSDKSRRGMAPVLLATGDAGSQTPTDPVHLGKRKRSGDMDGGEIDNNAAATADVEDDSKRPRVTAPVEADTPEGSGVGHGGDTSPSLTPGDSTCAAVGPGGGEASVEVTPGNSSQAGEEDSRGRASQAEAGHNGGEARQAAKGSHRGQLDAFGQFIPAVSNDLVRCKRCARQVMASKFAMHLSRCMGYGRNSRNS
eukprot:evm.model.scf_931.7 EVM.evm.TU.scf_931.7   scf_931:53095-55999(-)